MLRIHAAQINPTVGDLQGNLRMMVEAARAVRAGGAPMSAGVAAAGAQLPRRWKGRVDRA